MSEKELPWHLVESEETWERLVIPYLDAALELVTETFIRADTDAERSKCQGQMLALRNVRSAPDVMKSIKARAEREEVERLKGLEERDGPRGRTRPRR